MTVSSYRYDWLIIGCCALACYLPFINKAIHIDADMLVHTARQIMEDPVNPLLGEYGRLMTLHDHTKMPKESVFYRTGHPPLLPLLLAPFTALFPDTVWPLHAVMAVFYLLSVYAVWFLLGLFYPARFRLWGTLLWIASPVLMVNSGNLMWDVPITALMLVSLVLFFVALRTGRLRYMVMSGVVAGIAALTKVNVLPLFIVCPLYLLFTRRWRFCAVWCVPAAVLPLVWIVHNLIVFGKVHYLSIGWYSFLFGDIRYRMERDISYFGGALLLPIFWVWLMILRRSWKALAVCFFCGEFWGVLLAVAVKMPLLQACAYTVFAATGVWFVYRCVTFFRGKKHGAYEPHEPGIIAAVAILNGIVLIIMPSASMRYIMPMVPLGLLVMAEDLAAVSNAMQRWFLRTALASGLLFSMALSIGDYLLCEADRALPLRCLEKGYEPSRTWYYGRLSYAWYLHHAGFRNLRADSLAPQAGDFCIDERIPGDYQATRILGPGYALEPVDTINSFFWPMRTDGFGAGFYGTARLPYRLAPGVPQKSYCVYRILKL